MHNVSDKRQRAVSAPPTAIRFPKWVKPGSSREELRAINFEIAGKLHVLRTGLAKATEKLEDVTENRDFWMSSSEFWKQEVGKEHHVVHSKRANALKTKIGKLEAEIEKLHVEFIDKTELVKQVSELTADNKSLGETEAELKIKLNKALTDVEELSDGMSQSVDQVRMMQAEVERVKGEVKRANDKIEATRQEVDRSWIESLNEDGDQLDTNPKSVQVVQQNVALTTRNEQHEQTIAELTDQIKRMVMANDEQGKGQVEYIDTKVEQTASTGNDNTANNASHGTKREGDELIEDGKRGKKLKPDHGGKFGFVKIEIYVYDIDKGAFNFETETTAFLPSQGAFGKLENVCSTALPAPSQGEYTTMIKVENIVNYGAFDDIDRHSFHDWVKAVNATSQKVRTCRYFAHIPDTEDAKEKARAAAAQIKQSVK